VLPCTDSVHARQTLIERDLAASEPCRVDLDEAGRYGNFTPGAVASTDEDGKPGKLRGENMHRT
jgi:hypothetical protein